LLFSNPKTSIAFQLMGYPAAFTNTVLKGSVKQLTKDVRSGDPRNVGKVAVTALSMVQVARIMNDWRSDGKSEEKGTGDALFQAVKRVGGLGILADNITKSYDAAKYNQSVLGYGTLPFGPLATDALSVGRRGITPTLVRKIPAALSPVQKILGIVDEEAAEIFKADMDHFIYKADKSLSEFEQGFIPEFEADEGMLGFATGGIVKDVPNVPTEPDERIDKITGLPYNESAGTAYMDVEDRAKFSGGGEVSLVNKPSLREAKDVKFIENNQMEIDPDGAVQYGIEDSLLDLSQDDTSNKGASDIFSTMSEAMSSAKVAVLKQLGYSPSNIDEVLAKLPKTEPQYEEAVIRNVLSKKIQRNKSVNSIVNKPTSSIILNTIKNNRGYTDNEIQTLKTHSDLVSFAESDNISNRVQSGGGPARGKHQYEMSTPNNSGQTGAKTAVNRYVLFSNKIN